MWGLLPSFCLDCVDIPEAFPQLARRLGTSIESEPDLRIPACTALLTAIRSMNKASDMEQSMEADGGEMLVAPEAAGKVLDLLALLALLVKRVNTYGHLRRCMLTYADVC